MNLKRAAVPLVVMVATLFAAVAYAQGYGHVGAYRSGGCMGYSQKAVPEDVRLTDVQKAKIDKVRASYEETLTAIHNKIKDLNLAIRSELAKENPNLKEVEALRTERAKSYEELDNIRAKINKEVFSFLTDKQKDYYAKTGFGCLCSDGCNCGFDCACGLGASCAHRCNCMAN